MAQYHAQEGQPGRRRRAQGRRGQVRQIFHGRRGCGRLKLYSDKPGRNFSGHFPAFTAFEPEQGKSMRRFARLGFVVCCLSSPALAQSGPAATPMPSPQEVANKDTLTVGLGGAFVPDYEGSNDYRLLPVGAVRGKIHGITFGSGGAYLYVDLVPSQGKFSFNTCPL